MAPSLGSEYSQDALASKYGMNVVPGSDPLLTARLAQSLKLMPEKLIRDCGINSIGFEDLGVSKEYYPNHGYYKGGTLVLNTRLVDDPIKFQDTKTGKTLDRFDHTLYHELGHGWDEYKGGGTELSLQPEWLVLSGWEEGGTGPDLVKIIINDPDSDEILKGEWFYKKGSPFVRFYARRNPWDDFADTFSFQVAGLDGFVPETKYKYFKDKLAEYYE